MNNEVQTAWYERVNVMYVLMEGIWVHLMNPVVTT